MGTYTGACGLIPDDDLTWTATNQDDNYKFTMSTGASLSYPLSATGWTITFDVTDPTNGHTDSPSISIDIHS